ncbi:HAMP domain-containing sensor histidine kinase [Echinicola jeungdonensis]|uniref:histidine kinase n=1 Tax=Echinicola jeungdonensis TaxID=709343 RepID=A0ABV5J1V1_9BACT|nr:HAMP domain-containing sensor histidine kinase [Echinicola jeungdonensis]MDN3668963.1 HAMP domain-containing sensor histidine kinase [Echinicola jeungdonensis]
MSKSKMKIIILLMSLACLGLVGFQYYWVSNALQINQERFEQNVYQALAASAEKLEKGETSDIILNAIAKDSTIQKSLFQKIEPIQLNVRRQVAIRRPSMVDSIFNQPMPQVSQTFKRIIASRGGKPQNFQEIQKYFDMPPAVASKLFTPDEMEIFLQEKQRYLDFVAKRDSFAQTRDYSMDREAFIVEEYNVSKDVAETIVKANMKIELVEVVMSQLLSEAKQNIFDRVDTSFVKRDVRSQLRKRGINQAFELAIMHQNDSLVGINTIIHPEEFKKKGIKAQLFPGDLVGEDHFMIINFPGKNTYLLQQIWLPLSSSLIFLLIIILCFVYAIKVIIRQKKLSETKNDFINNMTHEFKTPIATVSLAVEALQDPELINQDTFRSRYLGIIKDENKRLGTQVEKVLQAAALDKKDFKLKFEQVNMVQLVQDAKKHFDLQLEKRGGSLKTELDIQNPYLVADAFHLSNIINNLLDNANKYTREKPKIVIKAEDSPEQMTLTIEDNGIGMSKDAVKKIFEKFYRVPTGNVHDVKGFGLGLAYVKTMVEEHQGQISVESELNKGSKFTINLPRKK